MGIQQSKRVDQEHQNIDLTQTEDEYIISSPARKRYVKQCVVLHEAALEGDLESAQCLIRDDNTLVKDELTEGGETALHIAAVERHEALVDYLVQTMVASGNDLRTLNKKGCTALTFAAAGGDINIAKIMVDRDPILPTIKGPDGVTPLYMATLMGHDHMANYLFSKHQDFDQWTQDDWFKLLTASIGSGLYGLAISIVNKNKRVASAVDSNGDIPLTFLARMPSAFHDKSQSAGGSLLQIISDKVVRLLAKLKNRDEKMPSEVSPPPIDANTLFDCLWNNMICEQDIETGQYYNPSTTNLVFIAAEVGNYHFLLQLIRKDPAFLYKLNHSGHSIFHIAIMHRHIQIFNLIHERVGTKDLIPTSIDADKNNMLHLAAKLSPPHQLNHIPGPALQMQREVRWYKVVEDLVRPADRNTKNSVGVTPHDLFLTEHANLMREGEKQMKQTAKSCMLVTILITTVVYTTAFTVLGGYDNDTGNPILEERKKKMFEIFPISEVVATMSSLTSILMFLSVLTSRYTEDDFLTTLPFWVVTGVIGLFLSIVAMMVTFCSSVLMYEHGLAMAMVLAIFFVCVPVMFIAVKYQLLVGLVRCTYSNRRVFGPSQYLIN